MSIRRSLLVPLLLVCPGLSAQTQQDPLAVVAGSVFESDARKLESTLRSAIMSSDPRTRGAAARVINIRRLMPLLDHLRTRLDIETDIMAASEEARAIVMLGGARDVDRAIYASDRFGKRLDSVIGIAAAHLGPPAVDLYFTSLQKRNIGKGAFFVTALWGKPEMVSVVANRLLEKDPEAYQELLYGIEDDTHPLLGSDVLRTALASADADVRGETVWFILNRAVRPGASPVETNVKSGIAAMPPPGEDQDLTVGTELLRRVAGLPQDPSLPFRYALARSTLSQVRIALAPRKLLDFVTPEERRVIFRGSPLPDLGNDGVAGPAPFTVPSPQPNGVAAAVMKAYACTDGWIGNASVRADATGRVVASDVSGVTASAGCRNALQTLIQLSLIDNNLVTAPFDSNGLTVVQSATATPCYDEGEPGTRGRRVLGSPRIRLPRLKQKVEPLLPAGVARTAADVIVEAVVTRAGCVRAARVTKPAPLPALNNAALIAVDQWRFEPATYDGFPVEMTTHVKVQFK